MNTKTITTKAAGDLVPGDVLSVGEGKARLVVLYSRALQWSATRRNYIELTLCVLGEFGAANYIQDCTQDSQFMVELPVGLTPVQAVPNHLLNAARDVLKQAREGRAALDLGFLQGAVDELDPPKPPTLEEALDILRKLEADQWTEAGERHKIMMAARALLARVPS